MMMKKFIWLILTLLLIPTFVQAEPDYKISDYYVQASILENGDMEVQELIVLDGTFNGYERNIQYKNRNLNYNTPVDFEHDAIYNATGIKDYEVYAASVDEVNFQTFNENFKKLIEVSSESTAISGNVYIRESIDGIIFRMYKRTDNDKTAFLIKYVIEDAVVMHEDIAELYWTFIGNGYNEEIRNLNIRLYLPDKDETKNFRVWAHGDLTGEVHKYENSYIEATANRIYPNTNDAESAVDIRTTFDLNLIKDPSSLRSSHVIALDKIVEVETKRAEDANKKRQRIKTIYNSIRILSIIGLIYQLLSIFYIYKKYDKEYKSAFTNDYNREFIEDYNVEVVDYIMNKSITPNAMSASIMNLIYKKNIKAEKMLDTKKEEYIFTLITRENLDETENYLIDFLFNKIGNETTFTTLELKAYAKSTKTYSTFTNTYTNWRKKVEKIGKSLNIFENHTKVTVYAFIYAFLSFLLLQVSTMFLATNIFTILNFILAIGIFAYTLIFKKRTVYGNEQYVRWKAFKKFLEDFGDFENKELPEISLWERYMVYATVFGIADKVAKTMNVKIKELQAADSTITLYDSYFYHCHLANMINSSVTNAISTAQATAASVASSSSSSGFGGGGGFSSGGGFGGGGGGGHGF